MPSEPAPIPGDGPALPAPGRKPRRRVPAVADRAPADLAPVLVPMLAREVPRESNPAKPPIPRGDGRPNGPGGHTLAKRGRAWAVHDAAGELVALVLYRKGAAEVVRRLDVATGGRP